MLLEQLLLRASFFDMARTFCRRRVKVCEPHGGVFVGYLQRAAVQKTREGSVTDMQTQRETERQTERDTHRDTETQRHRDTETQCVPRQATQSLDVDMRLCFFATP